MISKIDRESASSYTSTDSIKLGTEDGRHSREADVSLQATIPV